MSLASDMAAIDGAILEAVGDDVDFNGKTIRAAFMTGYNELRAGDGGADTRVNVEAQQHECWCRKSDLPPLEVGDPVTANGIVYKYQSQDDPDETGLCRVRLGT